MKFGIWCSEDARKGRNSHVPWGDFLSKKVSNICWDMQLPRLLSWLFTSFKYAKSGHPCRSTTFRTAYWKSHLFQWHSHHCIAVIFCTLVALSLTHSRFSFCILKQLQRECIAFHKSILFQKKVFNQFQSYLRRDSKHVAICNQVHSFSFEI